MQGYTFSSQSRTLSCHEASILIVADESVSCGALTRRLKRAGHKVVGVSRNGSDGLLQISLCSPSLMVLDMDMPCMDGLRVLRAVRRDHPELKTLVLTMLDAKLYAHRCMSLGAVGFLDKNDGVDLLPVLIERIQRGNRIYPAIADTVADSDSWLSKLSDREVVLLCCLARGGDNTSIANALQIDHVTSARIRNQLSKKLKFTSQDQLIQFAQGQKLG